MADPAATLAPEVAAFRRFSRFYTSYIGALGPDHQGSAVSLTEMRVLYEIAHREGPTAKEISADMRVDPGYVSRLLKGFRAKGWVAAVPDATDGRVRRLSLTEAGRAAFTPMYDRANVVAAEALEALAPEDRRRLLSAMGTIQAIIDPTAAPAEPYLLRPHRPGDMGEVIAAHGRLYAAEYGFDMSFEALVARIAADFIDNFDPARHCCWIAERDGVVVGSVFIVDADETTAKLRMLFVDGRARGLGIGKRLTEEAMRFARSAGYSRMTLWTNDILTAAREIYRKAGFDHVASEPLNAFGVSMVAETWERDL
ncbi:bifunctional helix-turn-helix transcriptional regulator/GNAT family N-acetyltransferase [Thalassobaculum litoreum]|uniref:Transcriptional regulator, MarR family with acetyltransferase activity n=1 Tax=Thalassobaculum litoreum DSM 18839 TaxID=1123362 RepID=A0A8G2BMA7_9PROT|nr:helix-turn-helix domain-containing GNAT family N-acetyltransferase [Thalassobaculum litoreum]SDG52201.1 transcriptional regulator, MarR family with acetyltransferase activity [Thalassobaculum litoreum DSM 18839]